MKASFVSILALASTFMGVLSHPTIEVAIEKRAADPLSVVTALSSTVSVYTAEISKLIPYSDSEEHFWSMSFSDSTAASISSSSSAADKAAAKASIQGHVNSITTAVNAATKQIHSSKVHKRQADTTALATAIEDLLLNLSGTLNAVIADLGLSKLT